jgi:hypothetical protein
VKERKQIGRRCFSSRGKGPTVGQKTHAWRLLGPVASSLQADVAVLFSAASGIAFPHRVELFAAKPTCLSACSYQSKLLDPSKYIVRVRSSCICCSLVRIFSSRACVFFSPKKKTSLLRTESIELHRRLSLWPYSPVEDYRL